MSTWEERLAGASMCEPRRPFNAADGLRLLARDAGYLPPPPVTEPSESAQARHRLEAVASWGVTQPGAAAHMKKLTDIIDDPDTSFMGWSNNPDIDHVGLFVFACSLYLAHHPESARFWWQVATGAGHAAAAYCLHLQHLVDGELALAEHWWRQINISLADTLGPGLDLTEQTGLIEALERFAGYSARTGSHRPVPVGSLQKEFERLADVHDDDGLLCRPDRRLAKRLDELTSS
ncbi:hypothetical protein R6L23_29495 [Streptomyces sp. SR27]|uniref:hypothetical protein n=1 Tax=Streptomyces sp. SR27 TaxID=3076630 RepID=UPI00295BC82E|nr:hypothetical protein [Streptomyces sp. SR27]MDV9192292.1 hypothetical protein [Streptomyces sp. SR27]